MDALLDVGKVALCCMMGVQIFGIYYDRLNPKEAEQIVYDCRFQMDGSIMSKPCVLAGRWDEK